MGFQGFLELYSHAEEFDIRLLLRDSQKNRKKFAKYMNDPAVKIVWGDLTKYADVLELVTGAGYVLHVGGMVSPAADYYPVSTIRTNVTAAEHIVRAVKDQPNPDEIKVVYIGTVAETGDRSIPTPIRWRSARGNEFEMSANLVLRGGHWCPDELPWPWDYDEEARRNPFFAQVWYAVHDPGEQNTYGPEIFDEFPEKVTE